MNETDNKAKKSFKEQFKEYTPKEKILMIIILISLGVTGVGLIVLAVLVPMWLLTGDVSWGTIICFIIIPIIVLIRAFR